MRKRYFVLFIVIIPVVIIAVFLLVGLPLFENRTNNEITVLAAASLTDIIEDLAGEYEKGNDVNIRVDYSSSGMLRKKIEAGARADLILSASTGQLDALNNGGYLLPGTRRRIASNRLVCITRKNAGYNVTGPESLMDNSIELLAIGDPGHVPAGFHAKEALTYYGLWEILERRSTCAADVRAALAQVETENADAGIVYLSDALADDNVEVAFYFPKSSHSPIIYEGVVLSDSETPDEASKFLEYVATSNDAFESYNFNAAPETDE